MRQLQGLARGLRTALLVLAALPGLGFAGGTAVIEVATPSAERLPLRLEYRGDRLRLQREDGAGRYLLLRDGHLDTVAAPPAPTTVATADDRLSLEAPAAPPSDFGLGAVTHFVCLDDTGRTEMVAGVAGRVYLLSYRDAAGTPHREPLVLSPDPRAREFTWALQRLTEAAAKPPSGERQLADELQMRRLGLLRLGTQLRLLRLDAAEPEALRFERPAASHD